MSITRSGSLPARVQFRHGKEEQGQDAAAQTKVTSRKRMELWSAEAPWSTPWDPRGQRVPEGPRSQSRNSLERWALVEATRLVSHE
eukprot:9491009-Pyramimonas_sp.AAC.1